jgi:hypothetical protein
MRRGLLAAGLLCLVPASAAQAAQTDRGARDERFHDFLARHLAAHQGEAGDTTYLSARADLDGDGREEVLVYLQGQTWCGPHSCDLLIFTTARDGGWRLLQELSLAKIPIALLATRSRGWRDLSFYYSTSLAPGETRMLTYIADGYRLSLRRPRQTGQILIGLDSEGRPLFAPSPPTATSTPYAPAANANGTKAAHSASRPQP